MARHSRSHLSDASLLRTLADHLAAEYGACAEVLADLAEVDARRLYRPEGFESLFDFCVRHLRFSRERAYKRIRAARAARRFPVLLDHVACGRLSLSAVVLLAAHLTEANAGELIAAALDKTRTDVELLLAGRFPRPDLPTRIEAVAVPPVVQDLSAQLSPGTVEAMLAVSVATCPSAAACEVSRETVEAPIPALPPAPSSTATLESCTRAVPPPAPRPRVTPLAPERFALQCTVSRETHDKLCRAKALLGHRVPGEDLAAVLDRALDALIERLEKRKFAATQRPRRACTPRPDAQPAKPRHVPAAVKRAVWERDGGRCTFVSRHGRRCEARSGLEFDHEVPVARGGRATTGNLRLRCRAHNQLEAEREFGAAFMNGRRAAARDAAARRVRAAAPAAAPAPPPPGAARA